MLIKNISLVLENHRTTYSLSILKTLIYTKYIFKKIRVYACFVDFHRGFDIVWHNGLLYKLMKNDVGLKFLSIIKDLYNLSQSSVKIR